ncbi:uncharacterized protein B0I36DRAFT_338904 [Microdochium trichocladiopsis]|uniref:BZIP domain-containing protein n=1 Tax=Microdochium trichocladiopsis TaxID=1682393 RepID=A0A9P8XUI7_9PEZI|nr:uncharacterized protein B0I36DRAFT_338904 [Microdochium trichocladiopsis]KAH7014569.1 hypothetical protein B0I36DRAFT_338904 [Microdochium trichocladiopsis]
MAPPSPIFRIFNPNKKSKEEQAEQRREQLRRAQNTYRQRKVRYVKELEGALSKSQQREHQLAAQLDNLQRACEHHGITVSPSGLSPSPPPQTHASASLYGVTPATRVCDVDQATLGMTFVLKIEEPCLHHVHGDPKKPDEPSGHAMTATAHLLTLQQEQQQQQQQPIEQYCSPSPPSHRFHSRFIKPSPGSSTNVSSTGSSPSSSSWSSPLLSSATGDTPPAVILDRLLALAPDVVADEASSSDGSGGSSGAGSGLTPIQAWDQIRRQPVLGSLSLGAIMGLAEKLKDEVKCHGFGAVVDFHVFEKLVVEFMTSQISFATA